MQHQPRFLTLIEAIRPTIDEIAAADLAALLTAATHFTLLDVREREEYNTGHLPHAIHLSKGVLERDIESIVPNPDTPIIVYCSGGFRSILAAHNLHAMGYQNVRALALGSRHWQTLGLPWL